MQFSFWNVCSILSIQKLYPPLTVDVCVSMDIYLFDLRLLNNNLGLYFCRYNVPDWVLVWDDVSHAMPAGLHYYMNVIAVLSSCEPSMRIPFRNKKTVNGFGFSWKIALIQLEWNHFVVKSELLLIWIFSLNFHANLHILLKCLPFVPSEVFRLSYATWSMRSK